MKLKRILMGYPPFRRAGKENNAAAGPFRYAQYKIMRRKWGDISCQDYFKERLYDKTIPHEAYLEKHLRYTRSWKYVIKRYHPDASKSWLFFRWCDYRFSRWLYSGLDAKDYISYEFYNIKHCKRKTFVTEGFLHAMVKRFNKGDSIDAYNLLEDKVRTNQYFSRFVRRRWIKTEDMTREAMETFCQGFKQIMVKPQNNYGGRGIYRANVATAEERSELYEQVHGREFILEEIIVQHEALAKLNPNSVNTYRIYSCNDGNNKVTITSASLRIGGGTDYVDNFHRGGYAAAVDLDTGIVVSRAVSFDGREAIVHPYTHAQILGFKLPEWERALELVREAHRMLPAEGYVAWDVVACADASVTLIEANGSGGVGLQQIPRLTGVKPIYEKLLQEREEWERERRGKGASPR